MMNPIRKVSLNILKRKSPDQSSDRPPDASSLLQYPLSDLKGALHKLKTFYLNYLRLPRPPLKLKE